MSNTKSDPFTDHEYDGIREYDNPTPGWWVAIFIITVVFAVLYFSYYHSRQPDRSIYDSYETALIANQQKLFAGIGDLQSDGTSLLSYMNNTNYMLIGKGVFKGNCVSCHGPEGAGLVGPNLTDAFYKNISKLDDFPTVITNGAGNGGMPAWKTRLQPKEIALVAAYVASLRGHNLSGPRVSGDHEIAPWPAYEGAASTNAAASAPAK